MSGQPSSIQYPNQQQHQQQYPTTGGGELPTNYSTTNNESDDYQLQDAFQSPLQSYNRVQEEQTPNQSSNQRMNRMRMVKPNPQNPILTTPSQFPSNQMINEVQRPSQQQQQQQSSNNTFHQLSDGSSTTNTSSSLYDDFYPDLMLGDQEMRLQDKQPSDDSFTTSTSNFTYSSNPSSNSSNSSNSQTYKSMIPNNDNPNPKDQYESSSILFPSSTNNSSSSTTSTPNQQHHQKKQIPPQPPTPDSLIDEWNMREYHINHSDLSLGFSFFNFSIFNTIFLQFFLQIYSFFD